MLTTAGCEPARLRQSIEISDHALREPSTECLERAGVHSVDLPIVGRSGVAYFDGHIVGGIVDRKSFRGVRRVFEEPRDSYFFGRLANSWPEKGYERREGRAQFATELPAMLRPVREDAVRLWLMHGNEGYIIDNRGSQALAGKSERSNTESSLSCPLASCAASVNPNGLLRSRCS